VAIQAIALYMVKSHPLQLQRGEDDFRWIGEDGDFRRDLRDLIGPYDPQHVSVLVDEEPGGPEWKSLLEALLQEEVHMVVTHLAPLSSAQRQQLIGVCAQTGAQLITPSDAGRNRQGESQSPDAA
jgi:hypothetical protein